MHPFRLSLGHWVTVVVGAETGAVWLQFNCKQTVNNTITLFINHSFG